MAKRSLHLLPRAKLLDESISLRTLPEPERSFPNWLVRTKAHVDCLHIVRRKSFYTINLQLNGIAELLASVLQLMATRVRFTATRRFGAWGGRGPCTGENEALPPASEREARMDDPRPGSPKPGLRSVLRGSRSQAGAPLFSRAPALRPPKDPLASPP